MRDENGEGMIGQDKPVGRDWSVEHSEVGECSVSVAESAIDSVATFLRIELVGLLLVANGLSKIVYMSSEYRHADDAAAYLQRVAYALTQLALGLVILSVLNSVVI